MFPTTSSVGLNPNKNNKFFAADPYIPMRNREISGKLEKFI
jgi:hypothetical protein